MYEEKQRLREVKQLAQGGPSQMLAETGFEPQWAWLEGR